MLAALAAVALVAGTIGMTVSVSQEAGQTVTQSQEPVVEVQAAKSVNASEN